MITNSQKKLANGRIAVLNGRTRRTVPLLSTRHISARFNALKTIK